MVKEHKIVVHREGAYPFKKYWVCVCGTKMESSVMGPELYREFAQHTLEEDNA